MEYLPTFARTKSPRYVVEYPMFKPCPNNKVLPGARLFEAAPSTELTLGFSADAAAGAKSRPNKSQESSCLSGWRWLAWNFSTQIWFG